MNPHFIKAMNQANEHAAKLLTAIQSAHNATINTGKPEGRSYADRIATMAVGKIMSQVRSMLNDLSEIQPD